jgi:hypothetical protein
VLVPTLLVVFRLLQSQPEGITSGRLIVVKY